MNSKTIKIQCTGSDKLPIDSIIEFQGNLKKRTQKEIDLITKSIIKFGFSFPFFIWQHGGQNLCLDGHGRLLALIKMRQQGYDIPLLPVVYIEAMDEGEAKNKLLSMNSQYGKMTIDSVLEFIEGVDVDFDELMMPSDELYLVTPDFKPAGIEDQGKLDEKVKTKCPECGHEF